MNKVILFLVFMNSVAFAQTFKTDEGHVEFLSEATIEDFTGKSDNLVGLINLADSTLDFYIDLSTLKTGIKLRDEHMRENHLETKKYPFAEFYGKLKGFSSEKQGKQSVQAVGNFTIHGVSQQVTVNGQLEKKGGQLILTANWIVTLSDHKIKRPKVLFLKLSEEQKVSIEATLQLEK